ncbi:MAG: GNAT family N-acetyltransferase [Oscillospiraceae bacterium]|jgi:hypothetical protein|nr:GNAT family N-acetyltransferase [Oscillospiraceae bacterium]
MPAITYTGPALERDYDELMLLLDDVFFQDDNEPKRGFLALLPKLYAKQHSPWANNYILKEDGVIKAAVGMYVYDGEIAGQPVRLGGIGNVAVARDSRRKGYMKITMDAAMAAMQAAGCAFGILGGQRQRYGYWGFDRCGWSLQGGFNRANLRHAFGEGETTLRAEALTPGSAAELRVIQAAHEADLLHTCHDPALFFEVLSSWSNAPHILRDAQGIAASFGLDRFGEGVSDLRLLQPERFGEVLRALFALLPETSGSIGVSAAPWDAAMIAYLEKYGESYNAATSGSYTVLQWGTMLLHLLAAQAQLKDLPDGSIVVKIHGKQGDETLRINVADGQPLAEPTDEAPGLELDHLEAMRFFLAPFSTRREALPAAQVFLQTLLPLPLCWRNYDHV